MPPYPVRLSSPEILLWVLECALIVLLLRRSTHLNEDSNVSPLAVAVVLLLGWNWRLIYLFALGASQFWYFVGDDMARFLMSYGWSRHPYFITWDGIWQGGTFYVHGLAMRLIADPLVASKLVSAVYSLLPLVGICIFTEGLYRNRRLSLAVVMVTAPLWLHLLLSTGTLAEMPTAGFMLAGAGFLLLSANRASSRRRLLQLLAALSFAAGTSFHVTAWMMVLPVLLIWFGYAIRERELDSGSVKWWAVCAAISVSYMVAWMLDCWVTFGHPLHMFQNYAQMVIRDAGVYPLRTRIVAYPSAVAYTIWGIFPLTVFGMIYGWFSASEQRTRVRWTIVAATAFLVILELSAIRSNPNPHAYRSTLTLATLLIPFAIAPLWSLAEENFLQHGRFRLAAGSLIPVMLLAPFCVVWAWDNHQRTWRERRELNSIDSNAIAVGVWLRQELVEPQLLELKPDSPPVRIWTPGPPWFRDINIAFAAGFPSRVEVFNAEDGPGFNSLQSGQYVITPIELNDPRLVRQLEMGSYKVYRFQSK